jgi:hypothetical protein
MLTESNGESSIISSAQGLIELDSETIIGPSFSEDFIHEIISFLRGRVDDSINSFGTIRQPI